MNLEALGNPYARVRALFLRITTLALFLGAGSWMNSASASPLARATIADEGGGVRSVELVRKLHAEALYAGFEVTLETTPRPRSETSASAVVFHVATADRVELEFVRPDGAPGSTQLLEMNAEEGDAFALRVVEFVRARLVNLGWELPKPRTQEKPEEKPAPAAVAPPALQPAPRPKPKEDSQDVELPGDFDNVRLWLGAGANGTLAAGGFGIIPVFEFGLRTDVNRNWGVALNGFIPLAASIIQRDEGVGRVLWRGATAGAYAFLPLDAPWFANVGLGGGVLLLDITGQPEQGFAGSSEQVLTGLARLEASFGRQLNDWLRVRVHGLLGLVMPRAVLRFDEREVATLGRVHGNLGLSLEGAIDLSSEKKP